MNCFCGELPPAKAGGNVKARPVPLVHNKSQSVPVK